MASPAGAAEAAAVAARGSRSILQTHRVLLRQASPMTIALIVIVVIVVIAVALIGFVISGFNKLRRADIAAQ